MRLLKRLIFLGFRGHVLDLLFYLMKNSSPIKKKKKERGPLLNIFYGGLYIFINKKIIKQTNNKQTRKINALRKTITQIRAGYKALVSPITSRLNPCILRYSTRSSTLDIHN